MQQLAFSRLLRMTNAASSGCIPMQTADILASVCDLIAQSRLVDAQTSLLAEYPCASASTPRKPWPLKRVVGVFLRDGFTDRYSGGRLVFPGTLRALAVLLPEAFPYQLHWKQSATHPAFYELYPTLDHVVPIARGGADDESNVITTSMLKNTAKGNFLLEELRWPPDRAPIAAGWDGLLKWFLSMSASHSALLGDAAVQRWRRAAVEAVAA